MGSVQVREERSTHKVIVVSYVHEHKLLTLTGRRVASMPDCMV